MNRTSTALIALALALFSTHLAAAEEVRHDVSSTVDAGAVTRLVFEIPYAHLTVQNGDAGTIDSYGYVTRSWRKTKHRDDARAMVDDSNLRIDVEGSTAYVRRNLGPNAQSRTAKGSRTVYVVVVRVPVDTNLVVRQKEGSVTAKGRFGSVDVELSTGNVALEIPKENVGELIARTRYGLLSVHLGDRIIENEGLMPRKAHYFYEGGRNVLTAMVTRGDVSIKLRD